MGNPAIEKTGESLREQVMSWVSSVPEEHRAFEVSSDKTTTAGIRPDMLSELEALGLPFRMVDGAKHYDSFDLSNIALHTGLPSLQKMAMRCWKSALLIADGTQDLSFNLEYRVEADELAKGTGELRVLVPFEGRRDHAPRELLWSGQFVRSAERRIFPDDISALLRTALERVKFFMMREGLRWRTPFIEQSRLAECGGASKLLYLKAAEHGLQARQVFGLILAQPYATPHFWTEFLVDGEWLAADPMMLRVLHMSSALSPEVWPENRSPGAVLLALSQVVGYEPEKGRPILQDLENEAFRIDPIVTQGGRDVVTSFPLSILNEKA